jgi:ketosteroid isomerase-like protein
MNYAHVWTLREGIVTRWRAFDDWDEALEAVGLRE